MSRLVSELGADVIDDTPKKPRKIDPRKRNYAIGISATVIGAILIGLVYFFASTKWLTDYQNMNYITYGVNAKPDEDGPYKGQITASIISVDYKSNYPKNFLIPQKINGHVITKIENEAFAGCKRLESVTMQNNILSIGSEVFINCTNLKDIKFSKNLSYIGNDAFLGTQYQKSWSEHDYVLANDILIYVNEDKILSNHSASSLALVSSSKSTHINDYPGSLVFSLTSFAPVDPASEDKQVAGKWMEGVFQGFKKLKFVETPSYLTTINPKTFLDCTALEKVVVSEQTQEIGSYVFSGCTSLTNVELPNSLKTIGSYAFSGDELLELSSLKEGVVSLGSGVFQNCKKITSFNIPSSVSEIPSRGFEGTNLSDITYARPDAITDIGSFAFAKTKFEEFTFPKNVKTISEGVLQNCPSLERVFAYKQGPNRLSGKAFLNDLNLHSFKTLESDGSVSANCTDDDTVYLPSTIVRADGNQGSQFKNTSIKHVYIPSSVAILGSGIFSGCELLEDVTFQDGSMLTTIEEDAFAGCISLTSISFPKLVKSIGVAAFSDCTALTTVRLPDYTNWTDADIRIITKKGTIPISYYSTIKEELFSGCTSLTDIIIPNSITKIGEDAFKDCTSLRFLSIPSSVQAISNNAFEGCGNLYLAFESKTEASGNGDRWNNGVKEYALGVSELFENEDYVYALNNDGLTLTIVDYKKEVGDSLVIPSTIDGKDVTVIKNNFLKGNSTIKNVTLPDHITSIGEGAFDDCPNLVVKTADGFNYLGTSTNEYAAIISSLENSETYLLNDNVKSVRASALLNGNINLIESEGAYYLGSATNDHFALVRGVDNYSTERIDVNENTVLIAENAFVDMQNLKSVVISNNVTLVGKNAFYKNYSLSIYCHESETPETWDFAWNTSDTTVYYSSAGPAKISGNAFSACITLDNTIRLTRENTDARVISIPAQVDVINDNGQNVAMNVSEISSSFMINAHYSLSLYIPSTITRIEEHAFVDCPNLVIYCEANSVPSKWDANWNLEENPTYFGVTSTNNHASINGIDYVIKDGKAIISGHNVVLSRVFIDESITVNNETYPVETIADKAFAGSDILSTIYIPSSVKNISSTAFENCDSLTVYFQGSATTGFKDYYARPVYENVDKSDIVLEQLEDGSQGYVEYLLNRTKKEAAVTSCVLGASIVNIPEKLTISNVDYTITSINDRAFQNCESLTSISIGNNITSIGSYAFYGCYQFRLPFVIPASVTYVGEWAFGETSDNLEVFIEAKTIPTTWHADWACQEYDTNSDTDETIEIYYYVGLGIEWEYDENNIPKVKGEDTNA